MRLIGYVRVSTEEQAEKGRSIDIQQQQLRKYCELHGHELADLVIDDGVSASRPLERRPGGAEILRQLDAGAADGIVVQRLDRLFRIGLDAINTATHWRENNIALHAVQESIDLSNKDGWLTFWIKAGSAEYERLTISDRAREVSEGLREQGRAYGPVPFGIVRLGDQLYRDPELWPVREAIINSKRAGESYRAIASELESNKIPNPSGERHWHTSTIRGLINGHAQLEHIPKLPPINEAADSPEPMGATA